MDISAIEFIDLSEVDEDERTRIVNSLRTWDPNVRVPWKKTYQTSLKTSAHSVPLHVQNYAGDNYNGSNVILTGNAMTSNPVQQPIYPVYNVAATYPQHMETPYCMPYHIPMNHAVNIQAYPPPFQRISQNVVVANDMNYHNNYVGPKVEMYGVMNGDSKIVPVVNDPVQTQLPIVNHDEIYADEKNEQTVNIEPVVVKEIKDNVPKSSNKSWASLFNLSNSHERRDNVEAKPLVERPMPARSEPDVNEHVDDDSKSELRANYNDPVYYILGEFLTRHSIDHRTISLQPRGLINRSNYCYINSILQALLACPPLYNLLSELSEKVTTNEMRKLIPVIDNMSKFVKEFQHLPPEQRVSRRVEKNQKQDSNSLINCDTPFEPGYIYKMLNGMRSDTFVVEGRQEDAEEFLGCLLNGLNDEMLDLMKLVGGHTMKPVAEVPIDTEIDKEWQVMGPKNKGCVTRRTQVIQTPISDIFNGHLRSRVHRAGDKSTDNIQPFFTLQLNIEKVSTVRDALEALVCKNQLEGVTSSRTNEEVEAWQQVTIEELPYVLVLHLKCFDFKLDGCTKIVKALEFPIDLKIDSKLLSSKANCSPKEKQYKLFAIVYHDGKEATKGHYITDAYHVGYARWLRYDDSSVKTVLEDHVLKPHGNRVPYLLFYRRSDSIRGK